MASALSLAPVAAAVVGAAFVIAGGGLRTAGIVLLLAYAAALAVSGIHAAARFRSLAVGVLEPVAVVATQAAYLVGFVMAAGAPASAPDPRAAPPSRTG